MRFLPATSLVLLTLAICSSSSIAEKASTNVYVADELYAGCMYSTVQSSHVDANLPAINEFIKQADENCVLWMVLWYDTLLPNEPYIDQLPVADIKILDRRRTELMQQIDNSLKKAIK
jgi:hypothetical protein